MAVSTTTGFIALLENQSNEVKSFALNRLDALVDEFWAEISEYVNKIEILHEDKKFENHKLAALLASKVYFHLGEFDDALHFAMCAEDLFDIDEASEYVEKILSKCIDKYVSLRSKEMDVSELRKLDDSYDQMESITNRIFERCVNAKQFHEMMGIAIETRRFDIFEQAICKSSDIEAMLKYAFKVVLTLTESVKLRDSLLEVLVTIYTARSSVGDAANICQCLVLLNKPISTAKSLINLIKTSEESSLLSYQICFDLYENSTQQFLSSLIVALKKNDEVKHFYEEQVPKPSSEASEDQPAPEEPRKKELSSDEKELSNRLINLITILSGDKAIEMNLQLLIKNNNSDLNLIEKIKDEARSTVTHNATIIANGILQCGTTCDYFLRENLNWLAKAVNWAKFTATATLGIIHKGNEKDSLQLMSAYLPRDTIGSSNSIYTEGGGLYALGLIHVGHGENITNYLFEKCQDASSEPVKHGAFLGIGLAAMGTCNENIYDMLKKNLDKDEAIAGEAAGLGIGLVMLASGSSKAINDLICFGKETIHEKINRGIALGIALIMFGKQEEADELIETLIKENDPIFRWSGMATLAMAYCGTGSNKAIKKLLNAAVSDTSDDVRRWALTAVGFIMFKNPEQVPSLVSLLAESYNPHVRYGAAMAVGIACAGTANKDAIALLDTLIDGTVAFVRQGALVAQAMVMIQQNGITCPKSTEFRDKCLKIISDRHEDYIVKFGATIARSIIDGGGCNMTISLLTRTGNVNMSAAVGLLVFQNFWFWYPLTNFISLALTPNSVITLNKDLKMPTMQFLSNAKPSTFNYPPRIPLEKEKKKEKFETSVLSIAARQKKKEMEKKAQKSKASKAEKMDVEKKDEKDESKPNEKELSTSLLKNPARIMRAQQRVLSIPEDSRYRPLKPISSGGFIIVVDKRPSEPEDLVKIDQGLGPKTGSGGKNEDSKTKGDASNKGPGGTSSSDAKNTEDCPINILGSVLGAYEDGTIHSALKDNVDLDDVEEMMDLAEVDEDDEEDSDAYKSLLSPTESGKKAKAPNPPEPFQYKSDEEDATKESAVAVPMETDNNPKSSKEDDETPINKKSEEK